MAVQYFRIKNKTVGINYCAVLTSNTEQFPEACTALLHVSLSDWMCQISAFLEMSWKGEKGSGTWLYSVLDKVVNRFVLNYIVPDWKLHYTEALIPCLSVYPVSWWSSWYNYARKLNKVNHNRFEFLFRHYCLSLGIIMLVYSHGLIKNAVSPLKIRSSSWKQEVEILSVIKI